MICCNFVPVLGIGMLLPTPPRYTSLIESLPRTPPTTVMMSIRVNWKCQRNFTGHHPVILPHRTRIKIGIVPKSPNQSRFPHRMLRTPPSLMIVVNFALPKRVLPNLLSGTLPAVCHKPLTAKCNIPYFRHSSVYTLSTPPPYLLMLFNFSYR